MLTTIRSDAPLLLPGLVRDLHPDGTGHRNEWEPLIEMMRIKGNSEVVA